MLKLSYRGIYGIKALYELARNYESETLSIREISKRQNLPTPFLEQVLHNLKLKGLVKSRRGVNGGYMLSRHPREITIGDAVRALEGPIALCDCLKHTDSARANQRMRKCVTSDIYKRLGNMVEKAFDSIALSEFTDEKNVITDTVICKE